MADPVIGGALDILISLAFQEMLESDQRLEVR